MHGPLNVKLKKILGQCPCCTLTFHEATRTVVLFFPEIYYLTSFSGTSQSRVPRHSIITNSRKRKGHSVIVTSGTTFVPSRVKITYVRWLGVFVGGGSVQWRFLRWCPVPFAFLKTGRKVKNILPYLSWLQCKLL